MDPAIKRQIEEERLCECGAAGSGETHEKWCAAKKFDVPAAEARGMSYEEYRAFKEATRGDKLQ
jgi:hypothetical protein